MHLPNFSHPIHCPNRALAPLPPPPHRHVPPDIMAQIGREEWKMNMVWTVQSNQMGANVKDVINMLKVGTYES